MADSAQKSEEPTARRLERARREGQFPVSREAIAAFHLLAAVTLLTTSSELWWTGLCAGFRSFLDAVLGAARRPDLDLRGPLAVLAAGAVPVLAAAAGLAALGLAAQFLMTGFRWNTAALKPDVSRLNPAARLRNLWSDSWFQALQALAVLAAAPVVLAGLLADRWEEILTLPRVDLPSALARIGLWTSEILSQGAWLLAALGAADLVRQRRRLRSRLRMSKQEVREEVKESEGNPQIKARIRRLQRDLGRRRMLADIGRASAVIVNPTHYAVALRYAPGEAGAPRLVAKGRDFLALRIRELAARHSVPVVENPPLARALYQSAEVGQEIPPHLYRAVAEVLAYLYRLLHRRPAF